MHDIIVFMSLCTYSSGKSWRESRTLDHIKSRVLWASEGKMHAEPQGEFYWNKRLCQ